MRAIETAGTGADDLAAAMTSMKIDTVVGSLDWTSGPVKNVAKTPLVGGQWRSAGDGKYNMVVTKTRLLRRSQPAVA